MLNAHMFVRHGSVTCCKPHACHRERTKAAAAAAAAPAAAAAAAAAARESVTE